MNSYIDPSDGLIEGFRFGDYGQFLESGTWKNIRQRRLAIDDYKCQSCGTTGSVENPLQIHHFNYRHCGGDEDVYRDVVTVCRDCHKKIHNTMNRVTNEDGRRGWKCTLPRHIKINLKERGLM